MRYKRDLLCWHLGTLYSVPNGTSSYLEWKDMGWIGHKYLVSSLHSFQIVWRGRYLFPITLSWLSEEVSQAQVNWMSFPDSSFSAFISSKLQFVPFNSPTPSRSFLIYSCFMFNGWYYGRKVCSAHSVTWMIMQEIQSRHSVFAVFSIKVAVWLYHVEVYPSDFPRLI